MRSFPGSGGHDGPALGSVPHGTLLGSLHLDGQLRPRVSGLALPLTHVVEVEVQGSHCYNPWAKAYSRWNGDIAQLGERGVRNAEVGGSSPPISTN